MLAVHPSAVLIAATEGRRRPETNGMLTLPGNTRARSSAKTALIRCSSQSCVTDSSVNLKSGTQRTLRNSRVCHTPVRERALTGMSPMWVAVLRPESAAANRSLHGRTLMSAHRCGVSEPVHPESGWSVRSVRADGDCDCTAAVRDSRLGPLRSSATVSVFEAMRVRPVSDYGGGDHAP